VTETGTVTQAGAVSQAGTLWRDDLDALAFAVPGHGGDCLVHRRAFRALVGGSAARETPATPDRDTCLALFDRDTSAFCAAAQAKILRQSIPKGKNLHLNSRDIRRAMTGDDGGTTGKACRVLGG
jgi:hypothetical protein